MTTQDTRLVLPLSDEEHDALYFQKSEPAILKHGMAIFIYSDKELTYLNSLKKNSDEKQNRFQILLCGM